MDKYLDAVTPEVYIIYLIRRNLCLEDICVNFAKCSMIGLPRWCWLRLPENDFGVDPLERWCGTLPRKLRSPPSVLTRLKKSSAVCPRLPVGSFGSLSQTVTFQIWTWSFLPFGKTLFQRRNPVARWAQPTGLRIPGSGKCVHSDTALLRHGVVFGRQMEG